ADALSLDLPPPRQGDGSWPSGRGVRARRRGAGLCGCRSTIGKATEMRCQMIWSCRCSLSIDRRGCALATPVQGCVRPAEAQRDRNVAAADADVAKDMVRLLEQVLRVAPFTQPARHEGLHSLSDVHVSVS